MASLQNSYNHAEYSKCKDISTFAAIFAFKCKCGKTLGRNKIFEVFRHLDIVSDRNNHKNVPTSKYINCFLSLDKTYADGRTKTFIFVKPDSMEYLSKKITEYLENNCVHKSKTKTSSMSVDLSPIMAIQEDKKETGSPLDFDRKQALEYLSNLPKFLENSYFAVELRKKWGID